MKTIKSVTDEVKNMCSLTMAENRLSSINSPNGGFILGYNAAIEKIKYACDGHELIEIGDLGILDNLQALCQSIDELVGLPSSEQMKKRPSLWCDGLFKELFIVKTDMSYEFFSNNTKKWKTGPCKKFFHIHNEPSKSDCLFLGWI